MDFASLMTAAISKDRPPSAPSAPSSPNPKYLKRADLEAQRQQAYLSSQAALQRSREAQLSQKRKAEDEEAARAASRDEKRRRLAEESKLRREEEESRKEAARRKRLNLPDRAPSPTSPSSSISNPADDIPDAELRLHLRALSAATMLFGETHPQRLARYRTLTAPPLTPGPIPTILAPVPESSLKIPSTIPTDPTAKAFLYRQLASYFTLLLTTWTDALASRPASIAATPSGKTAHNALLQSTTALIPLFRHFERGDLEDAMLAPLLEIVSAAQERRYVDANDGYLRLSIGKAAWPIGVTMVGIHERSAREKLHESDKGAAHIMSDEGTRKWLQSIKRCLSFAQTRWPPDDMMQLMG